MSFGFGFGFPSWRTLAGGFSPAALFVGGVQGAWYDPSDLSTMFDSSAGTTPVAMPGLGAPVPVGLMLDKSQGLVLGTNIQNGGFDTDTVWTKNGWVISGGTASYAGGAGAAIEQTSPVTLAAGDWVRVTVTISAITSGFVYAWVAGTNTSALGPLATRTSAAGTYTWYFPIATVVNQNVGIYCANGPSGVVIDNVSIQKVAGNHAIAANDSTKRPVLMARVNLLTYSEQFDNAYWSKVAVNVSQNTLETTDPLGGNTAAKITPTVGINRHNIIQTGTVSSLASGYTYSAYVKANGYSLVALRESFSTGTSVVFNLSGAGSVQATYNTGAITASSAVITAVGNGWFRISAQFAGTGAQSWQVNVLDTYTSGDPNSATFSGDGVKGIFLWGADLRPANIGANVPAYQRIADANTYDTSGFPLYLFFDGVDDSMYTPANLNLSGTDKVSVFAGVRKLSDAAQNIIAELSVNRGTNNGSWTLLSPNASNNSYAYISKGTTEAGALAGVAQFPAPDTRVIAGLGDISGDVSQLRLNGTVIQTTTTDQGSGNYGTYPLFIGARNNASSWLNGQVYGLIIAGSAVSAGNISATEQWVAGKTGITI